MRNTAVSAPDDGWFQQIIVLIGLVGLEKAAQSDRATGRFPRGIFIKVVWWNTVDDADVSYQSPKTVLLLMAPRVADQKLDHIGVGRCLQARK